MSKILDSAFRNELYKNLMEAGYDKEEAKVIVAKKYFTALKEDVSTKLADIAAAINTDKFDVDFTTVTDGITELKKMVAFLVPTAKPKTAKETKDA